MKKVLMTIVTTVLTIGGSNLALAVPMTFFGVDTNPGGVVPAGGNAITARNDFLGNLTSVGNEDFEGIALGTNPPINLSFPGSTGNLTAVLASGPTVEVTNLNPVGQFSTSGSQHLDAGFGQTLDITFGTAISAFGFYGTDISDSGGDMVVDLIDTSNNVTVFNVIQNDLSVNNGNVLF